MRFNTLAQSRTESGKPTITVVGRGSKMLDSEVSTKKAKQKTIAQSLNARLAMLARQENKPHLENQAWNAYFCMSSVVYANGRMFGKYCKNRFCMICSNIRKAQEITKYKPIIEQWPEPYFVTLTVKACSKRRLKVTINAMFKAFRNIHDMQRKCEERTGSFHLMGIRSLECNFNPIMRTYNPHFHLIVPNKETAEFLIQAWLNRVGKEHAGRKGQDMRPVKNKTDDLIETIKYGVKIFTDPEMKKGKNLPRNRSVIYLKAMLNILDSFHKHRLFDSFGFSLPKSRLVLNEPQRLEMYETFEFDLKRNDWINAESDETLTDYLPDADLSYILTFGIDQETD